MDFGGNFVFAPTAAKEEYDLIPESAYNHEVRGYASTSADYHDDGEVRKLYCYTASFSRIFCLFSDMLVGYTRHGRPGRIFSHERACKDERQLKGICRKKLTTVSTIVKPPLFSSYSMSAKETALSSSMPLIAGAHLRRSRLYTAG